MSACQSPAAKPADHPAGGRQADQLIYISVKEALSAEKTLETSRISVEVIEGVVVLSGNVPDEKRKELAAAIARGVKDVKSLVDLLQAP